jgi:hypothetical protein
MSAREEALRYVERGWAVIPVPFRSKNPGFKGWERLRVAKHEIADHFAEGPQNVGVLLGEPSGWIVDVDLDHMRCVEVADEYLPPTPAVFGRPGKPRSHRIYRVTEPVATKKHKSKSAGMLVELRSTGMQTVFPPSTHEGGEPIAWDDASAEPATVASDEILTAVERLAQFVLIELGERAAPKAPRKKSRQKEPEYSGPSAEGMPPDDYFKDCVAAMLRLKMVDHQDGSGRLFAAACRVVEHDLSDSDGIAAIRAYAQERPLPRDWSDAEIVARIRDAEKKAQRGIIRRGPPTDDKPEILIDTHEHRVVCQTVDALALDPDIYQRRWLG